MQYVFKIIQYDKDVGTLGPTEVLMVLGLLNLSKLHTYKVIFEMLDPIRCYDFTCVCKSLIE